MKRSSIGFIVGIFALFHLPVLGCEFEQVRFETNFSAARLNGCEQVSKHTYKLLIKPENHPINPSAWYAFKVTAKKAQQIQVSLHYENGKHRYQPKVSSDGKQWQLLAHEVKDESAYFKLSVNQSPLWVAGQEIINEAYYDSWLNKFESNKNLKRYKLGQSKQKRDIWALESRSDSNDWLIIIGRQHPPEVTGAMALFPFVETLLADFSTANLFRDNVNLLIVPLMNPDGVENGHWRHNSSGVDLNRDWKGFEQPETILVRDKMKAIVAAGGKIEFALDFHSTWKNLFYTMPEDYGLEAPKFSTTWLKTIAKTLPGFEVDMRPGSSPDKGVFKQYIADEYGVHSITYEVGDHADRNEIKTVAKTSALLLMKQMLADDKALKK